MADSVQHPGVRSLLAKFETNQTPPSDRGRSPLSCDTSAVRHLSRVRASFVTVEGAIQSANPGSPLRKTSGRSEPDMFGPKINAQEPRLTVVSPNLSKVESNECDQVVETKEGGVKDDPASSVEKVASKETTPSHSPKTSAKRPAINSPKQIPSNKSPMSAPTTTHPTAREIAKERANASAHTTTRSSTHPTKPTTRAARGSVSSQRSVPSSLTSPKAPTKPARLPASMTASTRSSASKTGATVAPTTRATANTSTRQSSVKSVPPTRPAGPTIVRKQPRPSLPAHETVTTKPVNNSFLTRMMRPTASSASKTHDKTDSVPPPKTTTRAPRAPIGKATERVNVQPKAKAAPLGPRTEKSQIPQKDLEQKANAADIAHKQESDKENIQAIVQETPEEPDTEKPNETIAEPMLEIPVESTEEAKDEPATVEPEPTVEPATEPKSPAQPAAVDITPKEILTEETPIQEENSEPAELLTDATYEAEESTAVSEDETKSTTEDVHTDAQVLEEKDVTSIDDFFEPSSKDESSSVGTPEPLKSPEAEVVETTTLPLEASTGQTEKSTVDEIDIVGLTLN